MIRIKELRKEKGLKQLDLAKRINVSVQTISGYETGYAQPPIDILVKIADALETSIDYLVGREGDDGLIRTQNEIEKRKELRPSTLKLVDACAKLNDMGIAVVIGYVARLIEENPEFLLPSARRI